MLSKKELLQETDQDHLISHDSGQQKNCIFKKIDLKKEFATCFVLTAFILMICSCLYFVLLDMTHASTEVVSEPSALNVISCYYNTPEPNATTPQLQPQHIDPHLCTHINVAFARIIDKQIYVDKQQIETIQQVVGLKTKNPSLKVLLSVGGAGAHNGFSDMVIDHASRKIFIVSIKNILRNLSLDGVDLDWEFPVVHSQYHLGGGRERQHFTQLLREIRNEYIREKRDYLLTVALAAPDTIADVAYDVDQVDAYVDYANIMTYDFHYYSRFTPFTGLNAPLFARTSERLFMATLNVNHTAHAYAARGLAPRRTVLGVPAYGHSFALVSAANTRVGAPAAGVGALGGGGFVSYADVCLFARRRGVTVRAEAAARVPYLFAGREWVSFESRASVAAKGAFAAARGVRGAMLYSLNADDHGGACGEGRFPLTRTLAAYLRAPDVRDLELGAGPHVAARAR